MAHLGLRDRPCGTVGSRGDHRGKASSEAPSFVLYSVSIISFLPSFLLSFLPTFLPCLMSSCSGPGTEDTRGADGLHSLSSRSSHHPHTSCPPAQHPLLPLKPRRTADIRIHLPTSSSARTPLLVCPSFPPGWISKGQGPHLSSRPSCSLVLAQSR